MQDPKQRATVPFDRIQPGDPVGEMAYEITPELVERHRRATQQEPYRDPEHAPISILAADGVNLADRFWDISQSVHAGQRTEVHRVPKVGDTLTVSGRATEKFVRRGRRYIVSQTTTHDGRGDLVARGWTTGVLVYADGDASESAGGAPRPAAAAAEEKAMAALGPLVRTMTEEAMTLYEPPGEVSIHTSDEMARAAGLPARIATGTLFLAYLFDLLYREYGVESLAGTELDVRIRLPVFAGDRIEASAELVARGDGGMRHRVRCRGPHGDVIAGTARVRGA